MKPITQVLLSIEKKFQDEIITDSGLKFYLDPSYSKEWHCATVARIEALPVKVLPKHQHIYDNLKVGDIVGISFQVVADFAFQSDAPQFMPVYDENPYYRQYVNGKGEWLSVYAIKGKIAPVWIGLYEDNRHQLIDGVQGSEHDLDRWLSQFSIGKTDVYTFNNLFTYEGKDYWKCDLTEIFAKKVKGHWVAVGDRVICKPIDEEIPNELLLPQFRNENVKVRRQDRATALSGGKEISVKKGDKLSFNPKFVEKYEFENNQYYLIKQNYVNGKWG